MTWITWTFDLSLAIAMTILAWRVVATTELFRAVVMFITFGLLMALAWTRLHAPDIALAEAAIGAGLTGVLLLDTLGHIQRTGRAESEAAADD
jgi:energy-converting hydrogenase B subunit D